MASLSSVSEFKELDDVTDFFKIILRAVGKPIHYKELSDHLVLDYAEIKSLFHSFSDSQKLAFFKDQFKSFKVDTNGLVSCIEDDIIEAFTKLLKCSAPQHFLKVIRATEVATTYFSRASESEKFKFFRDHAQIFTILNDGYVTLSEKPAKTCKALFKKNKGQVSRFFKNILRSHGPVYFTWFLDYLEILPCYKYLIAREPDVEFWLWRFFESHSLDFIISNLGFVDLPPHLKSKVKEDTSISRKEDEVVGFFVAKLAFFGCLLFPLLLKLLQESVLDIKSFFVNYFLNEIQGFFTEYSNVFVLQDKTVSLLCTFQHDGFIYFEGDKYSFEDQQEVIFFFLDSLKIECPKHYIHLSQMLEKSDIETDFKHAFVSSLNSVKHWFFKNNPELFCIGNNGYVSLHSLFKLSDVGKFAVQRFAKKLRVSSTENFWTLINSAAVSSKEFQNYFANFSPLDKFYFFKKFPTVFNVDFNGYVSCNVVPNLFLEVDVINMLIKELEVSQPMHFEKLCLSVENRSEVAREFFQTYSVSQKHKFFKSKPMHFCIKPNDYVYFPNGNSELEDKILNNGTKSDQLLVNVTYTSTHVISKTNMVLYNPTIPYSDSSTASTANTSECVSPGASGSQQGLAVTHLDFLPEGIAVTPTYTSSGTNSIQCSPTKLLSNSSPANREETLLLTGSGEKRVQYSPTISSSASSVVSISEYVFSEANSTQCSPSILCSDSSPVSTSTLLSSKANNARNSSAVSHSDSSQVSIVDIHEYANLEATDSQHSPDSPVIITDTSKYVSSKTSGAQNSPTVSFSDSLSASIIDIDNYANLEASDSQHNSIVSSSDFSAVSTSTFRHVSSKVRGVQNSSAVSYSDSSLISITDVHEYVNSEASDSQCGPFVLSSDSSVSYMQSLINIADTSKQLSCKADGVQNSPTVPYFDSSSVGITDIHECADSEVSDSQHISLVSNSDSSSVSITDTSRHLSSNTHGTQNIPTALCSDSLPVNRAIVHVNHEVNGAIVHVNHEVNGAIVHVNHQVNGAIVHVNHQVNGAIVHVNHEVNGAIVHVNHQVNGAIVHVNHEVNGAIVHVNHEVNGAIVHVNHQVNGAQCNSIVSGSDILHTNFIHAVSEVSDAQCSLAAPNSDSSSTSIVDTLTPVGSEINAGSCISTATCNAQVVGKGVMKNESTMLNLDAAYSSTNLNLNECTVLESKVDVRNGVDIMRQEDISHAKEQNYDNVNELLTKEELKSSNMPKRENNSDSQTETHLLNTFEEFTNDVSTTKLPMSISLSHNLPSDVDELEETHKIDQVIKSLTAILKAYKRVHFEKLCTYIEFSSTKFSNYFIVCSANEKYGFFKTREKYFSIDMDGYVSIPGSTQSASILSPDNAKSHQNEIISIPPIGSTANEEQNQASTLQNMDDNDAEKLLMPCTSPNSVSSNAEDALNDDLLSSQSSVSDFNSFNNNEQLSVTEDDIIIFLKHHLNVHKRNHCLKLCEAAKQYFMTYSVLQKIQFFKDRQQHFCIDNDSYVTLPSDTAAQCKSYIPVKSSNDILSGLSSNVVKGKRRWKEIINKFMRLLEEKKTVHFKKLCSSDETSATYFKTFTIEERFAFFKNRPKVFSVSFEGNVSLRCGNQASKSNIDNVNLNSIEDKTESKCAVLPGKILTDRREVFKLENMDNSNSNSMMNKRDFTTGTEIMKADNTVPCDQELPDTNRACLSNIALSIEEADIIDVLKRQLKLCNCMHYLELFSCVEKLNQEFSAYIFSFQQLDFFKRYPNHFHVSADNYVSLSESTESSLNSMSIVKDTSVIPFECKHTSDNKLTTIRSDSYSTSGTERCFNNVVQTNSTKEIAEKSKGNSVDTLQDNTVRSLTGHRREIIKTLADLLKSGKQMHFTKLCKSAEKLNGIVKKFFYSFADNEKFEFLMSYPQYFSIDSNGFVTLSTTMKSKVGIFVPCEESLKTCSSSIHDSKDIHFQPVNHNNFKIFSTCLTPHNEKSLSSGFQWNFKEEKSVSALTSSTSVAEKGISEHPNVKDLLNYFQSILHTEDVLHYEELYIELEDSNLFENYKPFFERSGKLKFFEDHSDIFSVQSGGFISLVAEADPKSCPMKDVYTKTTWEETGLVSDNEMKKSCDYTCTYEELSLSHCHMFTIRYFIKALREDQPLHFKQLVKDACIANPDAKSFFILFKTSADLLDFCKLHSMYFTIDDDEEMVSLKKSDIMPDEVFSLEMELRNIKSSIISKALEFYVTILKSRENLSVKESENLLQFTPGYVISFFNTNYPGSKIVNFFIDHPDCFLLDGEGKITLRTREADIGSALENTWVKCTTIGNSSVTDNVTESDVSLKLENGGILKIEKGNEFPSGTQDHTEASFKLPFKKVPSKAQKNAEISSKFWEIVKPLSIVPDDNKGSSKEHFNITKTTDRFPSQSVASLLPRFVGSISSKDPYQLQENFSDARCHDIIKTKPRQHSPDSFLKEPMFNHHNDNLKSQGLQLDKDFEFKYKLNDGNYSDHVHRNEKTYADTMVQRRMSESALDLQYLNSSNIARNQLSRQNKMKQQLNVSPPKTKLRPCNATNEPIAFIPPGVRDKNGIIYSPLSPGVIDHSAKKAATNYTNDQSTKLVDQDVQNTNAKINLSHQPPVRGALKQLATIAKIYNPKLEMQCINFFKSVMQEKAPRILHIKYLRAIASKSPDAVRPYLLSYYQHDFPLFFYLHLDHFLINPLGYVALRITSNRTGCNDELEIKAANFFTPLIHFMFKGKVSCDVLERCLYFASEEVQLYLRRTYKTNLKLFFSDNVDHFDIDVFNVVSLKH